MAIKTKNDSQLRRDSQRLFVLIWVFWVLFLLLLTPTDVNNYIKTYISDPMLFRVRHLLQKTPPLSPHLKVLALDDGTFSFLKKPELSMEDLTLLLENLARQKPKAILLDALLSNAPDGAGLTNFAERLSVINDVPIYSGAYINELELSHRNPYELDEEKYGLGRWVKSESQRGRDFVRHSINAHKGRVYAYDSSYEGGFTGVGHLKIERFGIVRPFLNFGDKLLLPHIALYAADSIVIDEHLNINGAHVPLDEDGSIVTNYRPVSMFYEPANMKSLRFAINRARLKQAETWIGPGDVVVIVLNFFTGSTGFIEGTPFDDMSDGILVSTIVDSILQNKWLKPVGYLPLLIVVMSLLGSLLGRKTGPIQFWGLLLLVIAIVVVGVNYLFSYHSVVVSWILPLAGFTGGGTIQYIYNRLGAEWKAISLENQYLHERALRLEEEKSKIQLAERLNLGRAVQEILLPPHKEQTFGPFRFSMSYMPAQEMSGDWIYLWGKSEGERRVLLGDVVGKGPSAAIPVAVIIGILGECERLNMDMTETLQRLNQRILELFDRQITCSCTAIVLQNKGLCEIFNAGSPGWILKGKEKSRHIPMRSTALGISVTTMFARETIQLRESTLLFTFTDGYLEGGRALRRLIQRVDQYTSLPPLSELTEMLDEIGKDFRLEDDRSLLMIHAFGEAQDSKEPVAS